MDVNTSQNSNYVLAFFRKYSDAENAIQDLTNAGIPANRIGLATRENGIPSDPNQQQGEGFWRKIANFFEGKDKPAQNDATAMNPDLSGYRGTLEQDGVLVSVNPLTPEERQKCEDIFGAHEGRIDENDDVTSSAAPEGGLEIEAGGQRIQLLSEVLRLHKEQVSAGEVRLRKEVVTEHQNVEVPVNREELVIERRPVERGAMASGEIGSEQEIRVPLSEEKVRVEKRPVVKEEVNVSKKKVRESRQLNEQIQREELRVDREGEAKIDRKKGVA